MDGLVTRNAEELDWAEFDRGFYEVKAVSGRHTEPVEGSVSMISCFGDTATAETVPEVVPVDDEGNRATPEQPYFDWGYVCPSEEPYREGLLETIEDAGAITPNIRLDDIGFPRAEYCHCERCERSFADHELEDWTEWRATTITQFVADAAERIPGATYLTLYPDPYPGHLFERAGIDVGALADYVDEFVVPIYDTAYETTYWLEALASGFRDSLSKPFAVELYAVDVDLENLIQAASVAEATADHVYFGYDASNARGALRRMDAESRSGKSYE